MDTAPAGLMYGSRHRVGRVGIIWIWERDLLGSEATVLEK